MSEKWNFITIALFYLFCDYSPASAPTIFETYVTLTQEKQGEELCGTASLSNLN
jgi:hypothetical protein